MHVKGRSGTDAEEPKLILLCYRQNAAKLLFGRIYYIPRIYGKICTFMNDKV
jgi:hypothetical protein